MSEELILMNSKQVLVALRMLTDPRIPREHSDIFAEAFLSPRIGTPLAISEERLEMLTEFIPDLVLEYREAGRVNR